MTLEEAITHAMEVAKNQEQCAEKIDKLDCDSTSMRECASEHRQLAEWLRELQKWRVIKEGIYSLCDIDCEYPQYKEKKTMCDACMIGQVIDHLERVFEEVNNANSD